MQMLYMCTSLEIDLNPWQLHRHVLMPMRGLYSMQTPWLSYKLNISDSFTSLASVTLTLNDRSAV